MMMNDVSAVIPTYSPSASSNDSTLELIIRYFFLGYKYKEILAALVCIHGIRMSFRQLNRLLKRLNLRRKVPESPIETIINAILKEISGSGKCIGNKTMWKRLKHVYGLHVHRSTVVRLMWIADPAGMERRKARRLLRRQYSCPGPNFIWHIDGYDKIKPYGFAIHGAVDGFSRKILWLEVGPSNNDPKIIARYFLETLKSIGWTIPTIIRSDCGTKNVMVRQLQIYFRYRQNDVHLAEKSFLMGKSTSNQRIESLWSKLRCQCLDFWINIFKDMRDLGLYSDGNMFHRQCLMYCFTPVIRHELSQFATEWNLHDIYNGKRAEGPRGKPDVMYGMPILYNATDRGHEVDDHVIDICMELYSKPLNSNGCFPEFFRLFELINSTRPSDLTKSEEAFNLYIDIISKLPNNH